MFTEKKVVVIGQGYVGLPLSVAAAQAGWRVIGVDSNESIVNRLNLGHSHIEDITNESVSSLLKAGSYSATSDFRRVAEASILILCVPTPLDINHQPDLSYLKSALRASAGYISSGTLIINESTSFPGTLREFIVTFLRGLVGDSIKSLDFASAPERVDPRNSEWKLGNTPRLVSGLTTKSTDRALRFYSSFCQQAIGVSSPEVAELAKLLENSFRQLNIALVNQLVPLCRKMGVDIREVINAAGTKPYGFMKFSPGAGVGGHCIPIDPLYLLWKSRELGLDLPLIEVSDRINRNMPRFVAEEFARIAKLKHGDKVLILGVAYKAGISDTRESPAIDLARIFLSKGNEVLWFDPLVEYFELGSKWSPGNHVNGAVIVTAQHDMPILELASKQIPILDCTGVYKSVQNVSQL